MYGVRSVAVLVCLTVTRASLADPARAQADPNATAAFPTAAAPEAPTRQSEPVTPVPSAPTPPPHATRASQQGSYSGAPAYPPPGGYAAYSYYSPYPCPQDEDAPCNQKPKSDHWYGWQTLTIDGASIGLLLLSASAGSEGGALLATMSYGLGAPVVHFVHGRPGAGLLSLGMRVALPLVGGAIGSATADCGHPEFEASLCGVGETIVGIAIGVSTAIALDAALLARETVEDEQTPLHALRVSPVVDPGRRIGALALSGAF